MNEKHFHRLMGLMDSGRVVCGGTGSAETLQIAPTVLADVSPDSPGDERGNFRARPSRAGL